MNLLNTSDNGREPKKKTSRPGKCPDVKKDFGIVAACLHWQYQSDYLLYD